MRTLSPFFTVKSTFLPLSSILPVPRATTLPSCGFSFAVSGMMIPPFFTSCSSIGCTSTRSPSGLTLTVAIGVVFTPLFFGCAGACRSCDNRRQIVFATSSCLRPRLRILHRRRCLRLPVCPRLVQHPVARQRQVRVADHHPERGLGQLTPA